MSAHANPNIVTDGLAFMYDTNSGKSYKGEPAVNLWDSMLNTQSLRSHTKHYWNGHKWLEDATYSHPGVDGPKGTYLGLVFKHTSGSLNSTWSGNSYGYMLRDIVCTSGATFTQSCWIYASTDCDVTAIPSVIEGESGGETTVTGYSASYDLTNKGTWQVTSKKATSDGNTRFIPLYPQKSGVTDGSFSGFFMWSLPQVVAGSNVVKPIQPGTTRSDTQGLLDLTKNSTINISNASFDSNAQITFDGTDDYIDLGDLGLGAGSFTVEAVIYPKASSTYHVFFRKGDSSTSNSNMDWSMGYDYNQFHVRTQNASVSINEYAGASFVNNYGHVTLTYDGSTIRMYLNGSEVSNKTVTLANNYSNYSIGRGINNYAQLDVKTIKVYNKTLTASEVLQNFNATKSRFGL